jgi:hypothetical protein
MRFKQIFTTHRLLRLQRRLPSSKTRPVQQNFCSAAPQIPLERETNHSHGGEQSMKTRHFSIPLRTEATLSHKLGVLAHDRMLLTILALGCFAFLTSTQAVTPAPDGGYPGQNTAEGTDALFSLTAIAGINTGLGFSALYSNTTGTVNTAVGGYALRSNTTGASNTRRRSVCAKS